MHWRRYCLKHKGKSKLGHIVPTFITSSDFCQLFPYNRRKSKEKCHRDEISTKPSTIRSKRNTAGSPCTEQHCKCPILGNTGRRVETKGSRPFGKGRICSRVFTSRRCQIDCYISSSINNPDPIELRRLDELDGRLYH